MKLLSIWILLLISKTQLFGQTDSSTTRITDSTSLVELINSQPDYLKLYDYSSLRDTVIIDFGKMSQFGYFLATSGESMSFEQRSIYVRRGKLKKVIIWDNNIGCRRTLWYSRRKIMRTKYDCKDEWAMNTPFIHYGDQELHPINDTSEVINLEEQLNSDWFLDDRKYLLPNYQPDLSLTIYPVDSLIYDQYVGETIAGHTLANGWRSDLINGGYNKTIYTNPYVEGVHFEKGSDRKMKPYRFKDGKLYTGKIEDTLHLHFTPNKIKGHLYGQPYYESESITVYFRGECINGLMQGRGVLAANVKHSGIYGMLLAECQFVDGEMIGETTYWDLNSVNFYNKNGDIYLNEEVYNYLTFKAKLSYTIITYIKGDSNWLTWIDYDHNGKVIQKHKRH
ncbi:MAG: hypothetical protein H6600_00490 [Flavobacteriales bacterium]|nr:hypothetical protein [Flavobacteriales bacterium]